MPPFATAAARNGRPATSRAARGTIRSADRVVTCELLAIIASLGNAGSNTAADHIAIIDAAIAAIPASWRHSPIDHHRWRGLERPWPPNARRSTKNPYESSLYSFRGLPPSAWARLARMTNDSVPDLPLVRRGAER